MSKKDPCKKFACKLQTCLKENVFQPARCEEVIEELRQCCIKHSDHSLVCEAKTEESMKDDRKLLKDLSWPYRYPRIFSIGGALIAVGIFYSGPLYNYFTATPLMTFDEYLEFKRAEKEQNKHKSRGAYVRLD